MRHEETGDFAETRLDVPPEALQLGVLLVANQQSSVEYFPAAERSVIGLVGKTPVPNEELQPLERRVPAIGQRQPSVLREELTVHRVD